MRKGINLTALSAAGVLIAGVSAYAAGTGNSSQYTVTMRSFDFCTDAACSAPVNVATKTQDIDIASATAGADVASYASVTVPPLVSGVTYTHARVRISGTFTIKGFGTDGANNCRTEAANGYTSLTTPLGGAKEASAALAQANATAQQMTVPTAGSQPGGQPILPSGMTQDGADLIMTFAISPITIGATAPTVVVKFDTTSTILFIQTGATGCELAFPQPPTVTVTFR